MNTRKRSAKPRRRVHHRRQKGGFLPLLAKYLIVPKLARSVARKKARKILEKHNQQKGGFLTALAKLAADVIPKAIESGKRDGKRDGAKFAQELLAEYKRKGKI